MICRLANFRIRIASAWAAIRIRLVERIASADDAADQVTDTNRNED